MGRAQIAGGLAAAYLLCMFIWHRVRLHRRRLAGPPLELLARFDYRVLWDEQLDLPGGEGALAPFADAPTAPRGYSTSPWELEEPPSHRELRDRLLAGDSPEIEGADATIRGLACHFVVRRVLTGDLGGAASLASKLPLGPREPMLASVELVRAERLAAVRQLSAARRAAFAAYEHAERALGGTGATPGLEYLVSHLQLAWLTHEANLEWSAFKVLWKLRGALRRWGPHPSLHFARAHAQALLGRHEEALDEIGRALYYSQGDPFYACVILEHGFVARARPALFAQCQALVARHAAPRQCALSPGGAEG